MCTSVGGGEGDSTRKYRAPFDLRMTPSRRRLGRPGRLLASLPEVRERPHSHGRHSPAECIIAGMGNVCFI